MRDLERSAVGDDDPPVRRLVRDFTADKVIPLAAELDLEPRFPRELYSEMGELGLLGITIPQKLGGTGARALDYLHVMEGLSFGYASVADQCGLVELVATLLSRYGTPDQQRDYLEPLLAAELFCAYALTEPQAGSDLKRVAARAVRTGAGWVLDGEKVFIHNAPVADFATVLARTDADALSVFLVDLDQEGVRRTYHEHKMGQRGSPVGGLAFDGAKAALLGPEGAGFALMTSVLAKGRLGIAGLALGISRAAITSATAQAQVREAFGRKIGAHEAIGFALADAATEYRAGLLLAEDAARLLDFGAEAGAECAMAKLFASEACQRHASTAVQVFGGSGYIQGYLPERLYRDARITTIYEGTSEIQRLIISRSLMDTR